MNRYGRGASKASSTTLCQKCLKRGHYSYECKAAAQERPYQSRPSRTQQFLNPKLAPKLSNAAPEDLPSKKDNSNQHTENDVRERRRRPSVDGMEAQHVTGKRARSISSHSSTSVSTISTQSSRSSSAPRRSRGIGQNRHAESDMAERSHGAEKEKRRRRSSSVLSPRPGFAEKSTSAGAESERRTRLRRGSTSPAERGRRRSRSIDSEQRRNGLNSARRSSADSLAVGRRNESSEKNGDFDPRNRR